jgi:hypothetical protein
MMPTSSAATDAGTSTSWMLATPDVVGDLSRGRASSSPVLFKARPRRNPCGAGNGRRLTDSFAVKDQSCGASSWGRLLLSVDLPRPSLTLPRLWQHAAMVAATSEIPCPGCGTASESPSSPGTGWRCPRCSRGYLLRRCSACRAVSLVSAQQQPGQPWACVWCLAQNDGFRVRGDPASATLAELVRSHRQSRPGLRSGLGAASCRSRYPAACAHRDDQ